MLQIKKKLQNLRKFCKEIALRKICSQWVGRGLEMIFQVVIKYIYEPV